MLFFLCLFVLKNRRSVEIYLNVEVLKCKIYRCTLIIIQVSKMRFSALFFLNFFRRRCLKLVIASDGFRKFENVCRRQIVILHSKLPRTKDNKLCCIVEKNLTKAIYPPLILAPLRMLLCLSLKSSKLNAKLHCQMRGYRTQSNLGKRVIILKAFKEII